MCSKRNVNEGSSSEEDESRRKKSRSTSSQSSSSQSPPSQSFRICSSAFVDSSNRGERKMVKIPLDVLLHKSEKEIRDILITELPQLRGTSFAFFAKDEAWKKYFCPCSFHCEAKDHYAAEWNGKNIRHAAPGNRAVYILMEGVTSENIVPERHLESGYETILTESNATAPSVEGVDPSFREDLQDEELQDYMEIITREEHAIIVIEEIVPNEGDVAGGYTFFLKLTEYCMVNDVKVQFGNIDPISVSRSGVKLFEGKVPLSLTPGEVHVQLVNFIGETISGTVPFTYTTKNATKKVDVKQDIQNMNMDDLQETLIEIANRMGQMSINSKEETSQSGGDKTQALSLLRMIVDTAAKINAMDFFRILFRTHVGRSVFKSFKDEQPLLEEIARGNGHEELACLLEQKHLMYRDDENESDDEVDWKALAKAIEKYQTLNDETAEKRSIQSTGSSELKHGYLGDAESSTSLSSLQVSVGEERFEDTFEEQQTTPQSECREEPDTCSARGSAAVLECSLPSPAVPFVGRNLDCEEIVANLTSNHRRIGVISGAQGIGKTTMAVQVGHMLLSKGWNVHYHHCRDQKDASLEISALLEAQAISGISQFTLFILDNLDIYIESDGQDKMSTAFQSLVESANENGFVGLLFVIRKGMHALENLSFSFNLQPLNSNFAVELLTTTSGNIPVGGLKTIAEACDHIPRTLMIARGLIQDGMSETDIINTMLSSDKFRKDKAHKLEDCHSLKGEESSYSDLLHLPDRGHMIEKNYPMFAPKEVASLRKNMGSFDAGRPMHFHPDTDQTIYNLMERLDTPPVLDTLDLERTDVMEQSTGGATPKIFSRNVVLLKNGDFQRINGQVYMPTASERAIKKPVESGQFKRKVEFDASMSEDMIKSKLEETFPYLENRRFSCAAVIKLDQHSSRFEFHGSPHPWSGKTIRSKIKGNSALYILEDEAPNSETETSTNISQGDTDYMNCIATEVNQMSLLDESEMEIDESQQEELLGWSLQDNDHFEVNINPKESPLQSKDAEALKPLVLPSFGSPRCCLEEVCLPRNARTETILLYSSVPCETVEPSRRGVASNMFLQKEQKAIRHTSEESVSNDCVNEPSSESDSSRHSRPFAYQLLVANQKERKSVCLWSARRKVVAILLGLLMVVCFVGIAFIVQAIRKKTTTTPTTTTTTATTMTSTTREACFNGPSTLHCEAARNAVVDLQWRVKVPGMDEWITFSHCNQLGRCVVTRPMLTKGIKVLNSSLDTVTLQRIAENKTNDHARIMCQVHYSNYPLRVNIYEIKFSATCVWIPKGRDLNFTRILQNMLSCERVVDIYLFNVNGSRFAYCNSCQGCTKTNSTDGNHLMPVFWNRLRVKRGSLLLTDIQENDGGLTIKVKVHRQTPRRDNGTIMDYTLRIFVNSSRGSPEKENKTLPLVPAKPINPCCKTQDTTYPRTPSIIINQSSTTNNHTSPSQGSKREHTVPPTTRRIRSLYLSQRKDKAPNAAAITVLTLTLLLLAMVLCCICIYFYKKRPKRYAESRIHDSVIGVQSSLDMKAVEGEAKEALPNIDKLFRLETMSPEAREPLLKEVYSRSSKLDATEDSRLLSSILNYEPDVLQEIERLDTTRRGHGHNQAWVALADEFSFMSRDSMRAIETYDEGPTRAVFKFLAAEKPELTVRETLC